MLLIVDVDEDDNLLDETDSTCNSSEENKEDTVIVEDEDIVVLWSLKCKIKKIGIFSKFNQNCTTLQYIINFLSFQGSFKILIDKSYQQNRN